MALSVAAFARALRSLLPGGPAFSRDPDSSITKTLLGISEELARVDQRGDDLIEETDPRTTDELFGDWEQMLGLPSPCVTTVQTMEERRAAIVSALNSVGGNTLDYFLGLADSMGITITIEEASAFEVGRDGMGDSIGGDEWYFVWHVFASASLSAAQQQLLECTFRRFAPAHTVPTFEYA
jgi:uncharacterized protein YmfQ (DUF2313 family)